MRLTLLLLLFTLLTGKLIDEVDPEICLVIRSICFSLNGRYLFKRMFCFVVVVDTALSICSFCLLVDVANRDTH